MKKRSIQDKISRAVLEKPGWNRKCLRIRSSFDQVKAILEKKPKKK